MLQKGLISFIQFEFGYASRAAKVLLKDLFDLLTKYNYDVYVIKPKTINKIRYSPFFRK